MKKISFSYNWKKVPGKFFTLWLKRYKLIFLLLFLVVAGWGGYEWHYNLVVFKWSSEERQKYLETTIKETDFQEADFLKVLEKLAAVAKRHAGSVLPERELFIGEREEDGNRP